MREAASITAPAERALVELVVKQSPTAMSLTRAADGRFLLVNDLFCETYGRSRETLLAGTVPSLGVWVHPELRESLVAQLRASGRLRSHEFLMRRGDGTVREIVLSLDMILVDGEPCILASSLDVTPRREAEASAARTLRALDASSDAILTVDAEGRIVTWNRGAERLYGYAASEVVGRHGDFLIPADAQPDEARTIGESLLKGEAIVARDTRRQRKDGSIVDVSMTITPVLSAEGKLHGFTGIARDITEQKRAQADLRAHVRLADTLLRAQDEIGLAAVVYRGGRVIQANEAYVSLTGYTLDEARAFASPLHIATPDARATLEKRKQRRVEGFDVDGWFETEIVRKDGAVVPIEVAVKVTRTDDDALLVALMRDITMRKRIEHARAQSEELFRRAVQDAAIGVAIFDKEGRYLEVNRALATMLGYTPDELMRLSWDAVTHPDDVKPTLSRASEANSAVGHGVRFQKRYLHRDGHVVWADVVTSPVRDDDGELLLFVTQFIDITARIESEAALQRERRLLAESQAASHIGSWEHVPGRGSMWSDEMYRIFGLEPQRSPAGLDAFLARVPPSDVPALRAMAEDDARAEHTIDHRVARADGSLAWVSTHAVVERDAATGKPTRFFGTTLDITERKHAEDVARRQLVQRKLVRRILRDLVSHSSSSASTRRELGRALASEATGRDAHGYVDAFGALNIGALRVTPSTVGGRYEATGRDLLEVTPRHGAPTCHIALGFLEGMVSALEGAPSLGAEVRCQSQGHEDCRFVVMARPK